MDYLRLASQRGVKLNLCPSLKLLDQNQVPQAQAVFAALRNSIHTDGKLYPTYSQDSVTGQIMSRDPNIQEIEYCLLDGDFALIGPTGCTGFPENIEAILFFRETGATEVANHLIQNKMGIPGYFRNNLKYKDPYVKYASTAFFRHMHGLEPENVQQYRCLRDLFFVIPEIQGKQISADACRFVKELPLHVAPFVEQRGRVVGFYSSAVLAEDLTVRGMLDCANEAYRILETWVPGQALPGSTELDPLQDALQWLKDCGGVMAMSNNPMSYQLIKAGYAKRGGYNHLGQRTLVLIDSKETSDV